MLLAIVGTATALTWSCPGEIAVPADARPWNGRGDIDAVLDAVEAEAEAWIPADCAWERTEDSGVTTETCAGNDGVVVVRTTTVRTSDADPITSSSSIVTVVTLPAGRAEWTSITMQEGSSEEIWTSDRAEGQDGTRAVAWTGSPLGLPPDSGASTSRSTNEYDGAMAWWTHDYRVVFPDCSWSYGDSFWGSSMYAYVGIGDHGVSVGWDGCVYDGAWLDGALYGHVNPDTWELEDDADHDGSPASRDCDDADPERNACATDIPFDGIDQDCSGADAGDGDDDGFELGDDCDDTNRDAHPHADDVPGDGVDEDCDGSDDVDADGDGYTANGDDHEADCDDADATVHPGADEILGDGIDQDCDGVEGYGDRDSDRDGYIDVAMGGTDCDDLDPGVHREAPDVACDGIDQDCDGADFEDAWSPACTTGHDTGSCATTDPPRLVLPLAFAIVACLVSGHTGRRARPV